MSLGFKYLITTDMDKGFLRGYHAGFNVLNSALSYAASLSKNAMMSPVSVYKRSYFLHRELVGIFRDGEQVVWSNYRS